MAHLEGRRVVHLHELFGDRVGDLAAAVAGVHAPQAGDANEDFATVLGPVEHPLRSRQQARIGFELAVRRKRHPKCVEFRIYRGGGELGIHGF